jgi:hypothetical protein
MCFSTCFVGVSLHKMELTWRRTNNSVLFVRIVMKNKKGESPFEGGPPFRLIRSLLIYFHIHTFAVAGKFRGVHTLNSSNSIAECTGMGYKQGILKHVRAFG